MKFRLNEDRELYEEFPITEPLLEKGDGGMGNTTQVICDLLDIVGCQGRSNAIPMFAKEELQDFAKDFAKSTVLCAIPW